MRATFIGDELTAAGMALGGFTTRVVGPGEAEAALEAAAPAADLVLLGAAAAAGIAPSRLAAWLGRVRPLVLVVGTAGAADPALARQVRQRLGIGEQWGAGA